MTNTIFNAKKDPDNKQELFMKKLSTFDFTFKITKSMVVEILNFNLH